MAENAPTTEPEVEIEEELDAEVESENESNPALFKAIAQKKKWREMHANEAAARKQAEDKLAQLQTQGAQAQPAKSDDDLEERVEARLAGHSKEEIAFASIFAKANGKKLSEALQDDIIRSAIEGMRNKAKVAQATPAPTNRGNSVKVKPREKMSVDEKSKEFSFSAWKNRKG